MNGMVTSAAHLPRHTIAIQQVEQILAGARDRGADIDALLRRVGIAPAMFASPMSRVTQAQFAELLSTLRRSMRDELWGLCRHPVPLGSFANACRLLVRTRTLGEALQAGLRYYRLLLTDFVPRLHVEGTVARVSLAPRLELGPALAYAERAFAFLAYGLACWLVARRLPLLAVDNPRPALGYSRETGLLFEAPVHYGQPTSGWRIESRWLELPVVQNDQSLVEFLRQAPASLIVKFRDESTLTERIRRILRCHLAGQYPSIDEVSRQLAMTSQTLRRRLRREGQGFRSIKDDLRRTAAIDYLARPDLTLPAVALLLGYSEASTFHRAFKQWTGVTPGEYRNTHLVPR